MEEMLVFQYKNWNIKADDNYLYFNIGNFLHFKVAYKLIKKIKDLLKK